MPCSPPLVEDEKEDKISESAEDKAGDGDGDTSSAESSSCGRLVDQFADPGSWRCCIRAQASKQVDK